MPSRKCRALAVALLATCLQVVCAGAANPNEKLAFPSPDGEFTFRSQGSGEEQKRFELLRRKTGKVLAKVAESDPDPGPSARFNMQVLWRPDSKAFAVTGMLWKRGSYVDVFLRDGATFRKVKLPELEAEISAGAKAGKSYPHVVELNSQTATRWLKSGSLVIEIETAQDGPDGSITAHRTVILSFEGSHAARIVKSTMRVGRDSP
jgi:hypothetical protein